MGLLHGPQLDAAAAVTLAAERRLRKLGRDPSLAYCFWLLARLASAARSPDFIEAVAQLGIPARLDDSAALPCARG